MIPIKDVDQFWPITGSGWIELGLSVCTFVGVIIGSIVAYGRWLAKMNGLGARVTGNEKTLVEVRALQEEHTRQVDRLLDQHEELIARVAESKKRAEQCSDEFEIHTTALGEKIDDLKRQSSATELTISQRLSVVETKIDISMGKL